MELKDFQASVLNVLDLYLERLVAEKEQVKKLEELSAANPYVDIPLPDFTEKAWKKIKEDGLLPSFRKNIPFSSRKDGVGRYVPSVCLKIPTGGGKTLLAANTVSRVMGKWMRRNTGFVLWIVPNESIYSQTKKALKDREHPYRQTLDRAAAGRVKILEKNDSLDKRDVDTHLCVMLLMLQSSNRETKESLRIFRDRGNVHGFFPVSDDVLAHHEVLKAIPNLDVYGEKEIMGAIVKDSLGNAIRFLRPVIVLDEGHKGYSTLALKTLYGFNPSFVLELSATPKDRSRDVPPMYSNWLVDVCGKDLDKEDMIKLPINVTVRGGDDWRDCLRESYEHLNRLGADAEKLKADTNRYIRPICLVQVERTGKDQREAGYIHAEDAREYLLTLGVKEGEIAIKTSEKNELNAPENIDLLKETCQVRFIITKQALQEGWDCPFAYLLCSLAPVTSRGAMTQLIGRILRQPDTIKTGIHSLDESYVFCYHSTTREVVDAIKLGLEQDGMADIVDEIKAGEGGEVGAQTRKLKRREKFKKLTIYMPEVNWVEGGTVRQLDYESDILLRLDWNALKLEGVAESLVSITESQKTQRIQINLKEPGNKEFLDVHDPSVTELDVEFDPTYAVRSITDIVPNPWLARSFVGSLVGNLEKLGLNANDIGSRCSAIIEALRVHLKKERDRIAEELFVRDIKEGRIQFRLRADFHNWVMPEEITTLRDPNSQELKRDDNKTVENNLFEAVYRDDLNDYEKKVACYLDGNDALTWWHRNVAQRQYGIQGWRKHKVYPDFIFALSGDDSKERLFVLETKGDQLAGNLDTKYKQKLLELCTDAFDIKKMKTTGEIELIDNDGISIQFSMVFEETWQADLSSIIT